MRILVSLVLIALALWLALFFTYRHLNSAPPVTSGSNFLRLQVARGSSVDDLVQQLYAKRLIRSPLFFNLIARFQGLGEQLKAGSYRLAFGQTTKELIALFAKGQPEEVFRVTLLEGWTIQRMGEVLENQGIVSAVDFLTASKNKQLLEEFSIPAASMQGYLFPDTYYWPKDFEALQVVRMMVENFFAKLSDLVAIEQLTPAQIYEKVIMASVVEREYKVATEAPLMASVFYNRLANKQRLESCATIVYVLTEELGRPHPSRILFRDLEINSPFNTYQNLGLPPAPISNPSFVALNAAFQPAESDYLFFVVDDPELGTHVFSQNLSDHNAARAVYLANFLR